MTAGYGTAVADGVRPENPGFFNVTAQDVKKVHGQAINIIWNEMRVWTLDQFIPQQQATENGKFRNIRGTTRDSTSMVPCFQTDLVSS